MEQKSSEEKKTVPKPNNQQGRYDQMERGCDPEAYRRFKAEPYQMEDMEKLSNWQWIPVSERLPSKLEEVLCCNVDGIQSIGYIRHRASGIECENHPFIMPDVVAWMPLPKSYAP